MQNPVIEKRERVAIRFAGDSGDGMQLVGGQFTATTALQGNDLATFPDYPAEIRAPAGTLAGVSGFQVNFSSQEVFTPGDKPDVLVAMNPAALRVNIGDVRRDGVVIANTQAFSAKNLERAGYESNPLEDGSLEAYRIYPVDITGMTLGAVAGLGLPAKAATRCKNFFALGLCYWMFNRDLQPTVDWVTRRFATREDVQQANIKALKAGYHYGETAEIFTHSYIVEQAEIAPGRYRNVTGNEALALGLIAAAELADLDLFLGSYPITPASDILHYLSKHKHLRVRTFQAEDEIAAVCAALGASYAGGLGVCTTSGPGVALKAEAIGLAVMLELPLIIVNVQRGGPSTGLPTKTEQSDLLQALYGRNGECPLPVIAASSPGDCFWAAIEATRLAVEAMTPVMLLSDGFLAKGAEPWPIPNVADIEPIEVRFRVEPEGFQPYERDDQLARPWAIPGTPGLEHRIGGLEKQDGSGNVCYDPANHEHMTHLRDQKVRAIATRRPGAEIYGDPEGDLAVVSWGGTFGAVRAAVRQVLATPPSPDGARPRLAHIHLRRLLPLPHDLGAVLGRYDRVLVPELNLGQLSAVLRAELLVDAQPLSKVQGKPFLEQELVEAFREALPQSGHREVP